MARAHNRGIVDFCSVDPRLLPEAAEWVLERTP